MDFSGWIIIGLGNPGAKYEHNRHNAGFMTIDQMVYDYKFPKPVQKKNVAISVTEVHGNKVALIWPMSYMNLSGEAIAPLISFYKIPLNRIIVIHDDLDITCGEVRVKQGGGHGGHNGLRNIDHMIGNNYWRIRIGISHPGDKDAVAGYVLSNFSPLQIGVIEETIMKISKNMGIFMNEGQDDFMKAIKL